ncbi:hypothetical protein PWT90_07859 [Aphanocladium album]|nr:hypothetical protein PWT90_07859 [Aphanocladium album]
MAFNQVVASRKTTDDDGLTASNPKRQRLEDSTFKDGSAENTFSHGDYTIGWICALPKEMSAAIAMLDCRHQALPRAENDTNTYTLGSIAAHNVVIACLPSGYYGNNNAATVASNMRRTFSSVRLCLMVGIGGGAPGRADIRLGDVVVSQGVLQYDMGKMVNEGRFARTGNMSRPPQELLTAVAKLQADHDLAASRVPSILAEMLERHPKMVQYSYRDSLQDRLFDSTYDHVPSDAVLMDDCERCDSSRLVKRPARSSFCPRIHYGTIASGNQVMKHGKTRDELAHQLDALCFEMEGAGLMDGFAGLVVRGICDYSDSHKNKQWQEVAAAVAAAYTKELLSVIPSDRPKPLPISPMTLTGISTDRYEELLNCLKFDQIDARQANIKAKHSTTCQWLLTHPKYLDWLNPEALTQHHGFLWLRGGPGTGKSTIMNFASKESAKDAQKTTISFFFNARGEILERSIQGMYRSLLYQLLRKLPEHLKVFDEPEHRMSLDRLQAASRGAEDSSWQLDVLQDLLRGVVKKHSSTPVAIFVDALDECPVDQVEELIEYFEDVGEHAVSNNIRLTICFSSRYYPQIDIQYGHKIDLEVQEGHEKDIALFIRNKLKVGTGKGAAEVKAGVQAKAKGIFMWVVLVVDILKAEYRNGRIFDVKKRLAALPAELSQLFKEILTRDQVNLGDLRLCIQWILFAQRPLKLEEYYFAVVSGLNPDALQESDFEEITAVEMGRFVVSSSKGLAEVTKTKKPIIQFIHESVREFWLKDGLKELWPTLAAAEFESTSHSQLQQCCYAYFKFSMASGSAELNIRHPPPKGLSDEAKRLRGNVLTKYPFLDYATRFMLYHANAAASSVSQQQFLDNFPFEDWLLLFHVIEKFDSRRPLLGSGFLRAFARQNYGALIKETLHLGRETDIKGEEFDSAIFSAIANDHQDAVKALLGPETGYATDETLAQPDPRLERRDHDDHTALSLAAFFGMYAIVSLLLDRGSRIEVKDRRGRTPLMLAAGGNYPDVVKLLLKSGANHLESCNSGKTALDYAIRFKRPEIVSILLEKEDIGFAAQSRGHQLLLRAGESQSDAVVRVLIESGAHGEEETIVLIEFGANIEAADGDGKTALFSAIESGHGGIARLLVEAGADINAVTPDGDTVVDFASRLGLLHFLW